MEAGTHDDEDRLVGLGVLESQSTSRIHPVDASALQTTLLRPYHHTLPHTHLVPAQSGPSLDHDLDHDLDDLDDLDHLPYEEPGSNNIAPAAVAVPLQLHSASLASYAADHLELAGADANGLVNPDDTHQIYRALANPSSSSPTDYGELMASTSTLATAQRQTPNASSLRSNSNGTTASKHPPVSSAARAGLRPTARSVSAPANDGAAPAAAAKPRAAAPSVRDLKRRFDQNSAAQASNSSTTTAAAAARKTASRIPSREPSSASRFNTPENYRGVGSTNGSSPYATIPRSSLSMGGSTTTRSMQRPKFNAEDHVSNNAQSFASRVAKPRGSNGLSSKSMSNLPPTSPTGASPMPSVPHLEKARTSIDSSRDLLFGEILPGEDDASAAGYGIENTRRRTSESELQSPTSLQRRSLSRTDAEPPSPTDWYRGADAGHASNTSQTTSITGHVRSQSDLVRTKSTPTQMKGSLPTRKRASPTPDPTTTPATSKLPVAVLKNSPASSVSPPFSRSNSPSTHKRPPTRTERPPTRTERPPTRTERPPTRTERPPTRTERPPTRTERPPTRTERPPTRTEGKIPKPSPRATSTARAKTPTGTAGGKRQSGAVTPNNNTRLNAYISAPPPKLSPPLRSSRPRQPVSSATTASSRMKAVERGRSPSKADSKGLKVNDPSRRRKISMGPIDFDARREQIKLSYTKSIQETEAKAAAKRQAILEREKRRREEEEEEEEEAAHAAAAAAAAADKQREVEAQANLELPKAGQPESQTVDLEIHASREETPREDRGPESESRAEHSHQPLLTVTTTIVQERPASVLLPNAAPTSSDSPTLGIPGSFPPFGASGLDDDAPPSAVSDTTEFDGEPQTEPPVQQSLEASTPDIDRNLASKDATPVRVVAHYKSPFDDSPTDETASIKIALEETPAEPAGLAIASDDAGDDEPGISRPQPYDEDEYIPQPYVAAPSYETTVTIIGRSSYFSANSPQEGDQVSSSCDAQSEEATPDEDQPHSLGHKLTKSSISHSLEAPSSDEYSDRDPPLGILEEFYIGPKVAGSISRIHNSGSRVSTDHTRTWSGEKNEQSADLPRISAETKRTVDTRPSLTVPRRSNLGNRTSQNTVWTDYSMDSKDEFPDYSVKGYRRDSAYREADSISTRSGRGSRMYPSSPETSPHGSYRSPRQTPGNGHRFPGHQLPELDTGAGFAVDYVTRKQNSSLVVPMLPDHSPPPPPEEAAFPDLGSAPPSEYYDDTRPNSYLHSAQDEQGAFSPSRPQSEGFDLPGSTPRSTDHGSLDISEGPVSTRTRVDSQTTLADSLDQQENSTGLPAKERKRLFTRLETIKELINTEAFFIRDMNIVEEIYKGTAEACPKLDDNTIKLIFRNTDQIIAFHTAFLAELKEGVSSVYVPKNHRSLAQKESSSKLDSTASASPAPGQLDDGKDRETSLGPIFQRNIDKMKVAHETFLKNSDHAAKRLIQIQEDPTVKVWLNECNEVARDLTKAWNLDSLLIKPMQRITKYPNLLVQLLHETPADHPDRPALETAKGVLEDAIEEINKTKKNFELVGQIVGRKRKDSNVGGFARALGKRVDKLQAASNRPPEDAEYLKLHEKFGDDYLRLQVVLRDVEFYTRQVTAYVHEFLQYLSSMELVMRLQPSPHPEIESKWVRFNVSMRDIEKVALEQHLSHVRKQVIEPFEQVIKAYSNPSLAMKKRSKRRLDYEKSAQLKKSGKKLDKQLAEAVEQYDALNEALKKELPKLSALTEKVGNICLGNFVTIQTQWFSIWKEKVKVVLENPQVPEISSIMTSFQQDYKFQEEQINTMTILNSASKSRTSQSTSNDDTASLRLRPRPSETSVSRGRGLSVNSDMASNIPTPDFVKRHSGQFVASPSNASIPSPPQFYYRDYYAGITAGQTSATPAGSATPNTPDLSGLARPPAAGVIRPGTGQSHESGGATRQSAEWNGQAAWYSNSVHSSSGYQSPPEPAQTQRFSGLFHSALPMSDAAERSVRPSRASSRASSRERQNTSGYNVLWLAASLFEFNIETTKHEAGYPYLTYQAGEIFDVIAEKGELWLAKNQDDPNNLVGWLWSKHFAKLADD